MARCQSKDWHFSSSTTKVCKNDAVVLCRTNVFAPWEYMCQEHLDKLRRKAKEVMETPLRGDDA
jgi:hypothetical protein